MLEKIFSSASAAGLDLDIDRRRKEFSIKFLPGAAPGAARSLVYPLLAALEELFQTVVYGAPACLMPDAAEHFAWPLKAQGPFRRIPACARCALKGRCPGVNRAWDGAAVRGLLCSVLPAPAELVLELSKKCNLECRACFGRAGLELPAAAAEKALREAAALGVKTARFTGGEPLLYPDLEKLLRLARRLNFYIILNSNAVLFTPGMAARLKGLVDNALVSLPGVDEAGNASGSGIEGQFGNKKKGIKRLRPSGVKILRAGTVVSKGLIFDFEKQRKAVGRLGFGIWELYRPMLDDKALKAAPEFDISAGDLKKLAAKVAAQGAGGARAVLANPVPFCALPAAARPYALGARFDDGWTRLVLDAGGFYKPSYPSRLNLGRSLEGAWAGKYLKKLRGGAWLQPECRVCRLLAQCLGGSRFQAEAAGSLYGRDPLMKAGGLG